MANCQDSISVSQDKLTIAKLYYDSAFLCLSNKDYYSAMPKLIKTAALVENLPEDMTDEEIHLTSRAYYQMAYVFQKMIMTSYAVETALRASQYQDMRQDTAWMLFTKIRLAEYYQVTKNKDSVDYYLKQVIPLSDSVKYTYEYNTALRLAARNYYDKEEYDTAFILYKDIINFKQRHGMTTLNDSISLGILMFHSPYEYQSKPYLAKAFDKIERNPSANMRDMGLIFFLLSKLYEKEGNSDSVSICHKLMPEFIDYMAEEKSDELKLELMYNNFKTERDQRLYELRLQKEKIRNRNVAIYCLPLAENVHAVGQGAALGRIVGTPDAVGVLGLVQKNLAICTLQRLGRLDIKDEQATGHQEKMDTRKSPLECSGPRDVIYAVQTADAGVNGAVQIQLLHALAQEDGRLFHVQVTALFGRNRQHLRGLVHTDHLIPA